MKKPDAEPQIDGIVADNVVRFPDRLNSEPDEALCAVLSALLADEFKKFKGRPPL